jgi:ATP phosphoribosyltransferase regulatory subunit
MTPQVARIDAHRLRRESPTRLCYLGTVLHTRPDGFASGRAPLQIGAEVFGHDGVESDVEVLRLFVATLELAGIDNAYLDLGHVGIFRALARQAGLDRARELALFDALQRKAIPEIHELIERARIAPAVGEMLLALPELNGDDALARAQRALAAADPPVQEALVRLRQVADETARWLPALSVHFDLAELRGYNYKTGIVFAAFVPGWGLEIGRGGRYDNIGLVFGRSRPAVGFSTDLKGLIAQGAMQEPAVGAPMVVAPWSTDPGLLAAVERLRRAGRRVVHQLPGAADDLPADGERLVQENGGWLLRRMTGE